MKNEPEQVVKAPPTPNEVLVKEWNQIVRWLIMIENAWPKHTQNWLRARDSVIDLHPLAQRTFNKLWHRQPLYFVLDELAKEARTGFKKLLITEEQK